MNILKAFTALAFGSLLLAGCGANKDESTAQTGSPLARGRNTCFTCG